LPAYESIPMALKQTTRVNRPKRIIEDFEKLINQIVL